MYQAQTSNTKVLDTKYIVVNKISKKKKLLSKHLMKADRSVNYEYVTHTGWQLYML